MKLLFLSLFFSYFSFLLSTCPTNSTDTCLHITMTDFAGDGWDGVKLFVEFPDGGIGSDAPDVEHPTIERDVCTSANSTGVFYITAAAEDPSIVPRNTWEIFWKVDICVGNTTETFTGGYNTTMIFSFDSSGEGWSLAYYEHLLPNVRVCGEVCGGAEQCDNDGNGGGDGSGPGPRPRRRRRRDNDDNKRGKRNNDDEERRNRPGRNGAGGKGSDDHSNNSTRRFLDTNISAPSYGEPYVDERITMYDQEGDGWWVDDYLGISWYLADSTRTNLFYTGTLCNGTNGFCNICLADGDYTLRVSGEKSSFIAWDFCGVRGTYSEELVFEVHDNECYPSGLLDLTNPNNQNITYVFESSLEVCLLEENLDLTDANAVATITNTLIQVLGVNGASVIVEQEEEEGAGENSGPSKPSAPSRKNDDKNKRSKKEKPSAGGDGSEEEEEPTIYNHNIKFTITVQVNTDQLHTLEVLEQYEQLLSEKTEDGSFLSALIANGAVYGYAPFINASCAHSSEFSIVSSHFDNSLPFVASTLLFTPSSTGHHQEVVASYDYSAISLFFGSVIVGFIAFVGILSKGFNGYDTLSNESQHEIGFSSSNHSTSSHGLLPYSNTIDMDQTISNPLGRNAALEVQMEQVSKSI